jgi:hypothetical protein
MNESDYRTIQALARCSFQSGSWTKRFVHDLATFPPERELSERQRSALTKVAWHYRKQLARYGVAVVTKPPEIEEEERQALEAEQQAERERLKAWNEGKPLL